MATYLSTDELRQVIRQQMLSKGLTQAQWAQRAGISAPYLSDFLSGRRGPSDKILKAAGFDTRPYYHRKRT